MTTQAKQKYTAEFKENAVKRANESDNVAETARELGIKENTRYNRVYQYSRHAKPDKAVRTDEHLYDELKRLKKENERLTEERDNVSLKVLTHQTIVQKLDALSAETQKLAIIYQKKISRFGGVEKIHSAKSV